MLPATTPLSLVLPPASMAVTVSVPDIVSDVSDRTKLDACNPSTVSALVPPLPTGTLVKLL